MEKVINELEDTSLESNSSNREKTALKTCTVTGTCGTAVRARVLSVPLAFQEKRKYGAEKLSGEIISENFPSLGKHTNLQFEKHSKPHPGDTERNRYPETSQTTEPCRQAGKDLRRSQRKRQNNVLNDWGFHWKPQRPEESSPIPFQGLNEKLGKIYKKQERRYATKKPSKSPKRQYWRHKEQKPRKTHRKRGAEL